MPLDIQTKDSSGEEKEKPKTYSFSTLILSFFMLAMILVSGLVIMTSYIGTQDVVQQSISQLSERIKLIAKLTFDEYVQRTVTVEQSLIGSSVLVSAVMDKNKAEQEKFLSAIYHSYQEGQLDLLFLQNGHGNHDVVDVSQTVFNVENLIRQALFVPRSTYKNFLIVDERETEDIYAIINKSVLVAEETGRALGYVYTGMILNDNLELLNEVQENTHSESVYLQFGNSTVSSLYATKENNTENSNANDSRNLVITTDVDVMTPATKALRLKISYPYRMISMIEQAYSHTIFRVSFIIVIIILVFFVILKWLTRYATSSLTSYAAAIAQDKKEAHFKPGRIRDFNEVGRTLNCLIKDMAEAEDKILQSNRELEKLARIASAAKDDLKKTNLDLENANRELEEFAYRTSHDLRSPLVSSLALLDVAEKAIQEQDKDMAWKSLTMIRDSLTRLEMLIRDILILNEIKNREEPYEEINIKEIVGESLKKLATMDNFEKITIKEDYQCPHFYTKRLKSQMIIENLLSNAIKYYDPEKTKPYIKIASREEGGYYILQVKDNGLGIPRDQREKLFTMFSRLHPKVSFGSGLGLYLIKKGAQALGGDIRYKNHSEGSIFEFILPLTDNNHKRETPRQKDIK